MMMMMMMDECYFVGQRPSVRVNYMFMSMFFTSRRVPTMHFYMPNGNKNFVVVSFDAKFSYVPDGNGKEMLSLVLTLSYLRSNQDEDQRSCLTDGNSFNNKIVLVCGEERRGMELSNNTLSPPQ